MSYEFFEHVDLKETNIFLRYKEISAGQERFRLEELDKQIKCQFGYYHGYIFHDVLFILRNTLSFIVLLV